jgi:hypothetical protein
LKRPTEASLTAPVGRPGYRRVFEINRRLGHGRWLVPHVWMQCNGHNSRAEAGPRSAWREDFLGGRHDVAGARAHSSIGATPAIAADARRCHSVKSLQIHTLQHDIPFAESLCASGRQGSFILGEGVPTSRPRQKNRKKKR